MVLIVLERQYAYDHHVSPISPLAEVDGSRGAFLRLGSQISEIRTNGSRIPDSEISYASGAELETQLEVGRRIKSVSEPEADTLIADAQEVARMIRDLTVNGS